MKRSSLSYAEVYYSTGADKCPDCLRNLTVEDRLCTYELEYDSSQLCADYKCTRCGTRSSAKHTSNYGSSNSSSSSYSGNPYNRRINRKLNSDKPSNRRLNRRVNR